jgi:formate dehydrogenase major subunit
MLCDGARGMTYQRLESAGLQWPCPSDDHPGTRILHAERFAAGPRAALQAVEYRPTPETVSDAYPFLLNTGRSLYQFNAGTMTRRTANNVLRPADLLDVSPDDAADLSVHDGDAIRVVSRYGSAVLPARVNAAIARGQLFATFQTPAAFLNALTSPHRDAIVGTPEYKVTAVRIERTA